MLKSLFVLSLLFFAQTSQVEVSSPKTGETLRGKIQIIGNLNVPNFSSAELAFSYAAAPDSWFNIQNFYQPPADSTLTTWDTTLVTDGDYTLHLRVLFQDGSSQDIVISDLKIRNDEIPVTETPTSAQEESSLPITATLSPLETSTPTPIFPTPVALPRNPASITNFSIFDYLTRGGLIALALFAFFSLILRLRKN